MPDPIDGSCSKVPPPYLCDPDAKGASASNATTSTSTTKATSTESVEDPDARVCGGPQMSSLPPNASKGAPTTMSSSEMAAMAAFAKTKAALEKPMPRSEVEHANDKCTAKKEETAKEIATGAGHVVGAAVGFALGLFAKRVDTVIGATAFGFEAGAYVGEEIVKHVVEPCDLAVPPGGVDESK